jgi:hypothetical protein
MTALGDFTAGDVLTAADLNDIGTWTTYTPVWTGVTVGNGTVTARYCQINKLVFWQVELVVGSTTSVGTTNVRITYPVSAAQYFLAGNGGQVTHEDATGTDYIGTLIRFDVNGAYVYVVGASSTYASVGPISSTVPFTWAAGDRIIIQDFYEAA